MSVGFIVMCAYKSVERPEFFAPLAYGRKNEISPNELLRRGRATLFLSADDARDALEKTLQLASNAGAVWPSKFQYQIIEVSK